MNTLNGTCIMDMSTMCNGDYGQYLKRLHNKERQQVMERIVDSKYLFNSELYKRWQSDSSRCDGRLPSSKKKRVALKKGPKAARVYYKGFSRETSVLCRELGAVFGANCFTVSKEWETFGRVHPQKKKLMRCNSCLDQQVSFSMMKHMKYLEDNILSNF